MQKNIPCIVIYAEINEKKNYIMRLSERYDGKKIPSYSTDVNDAMPFLTQQETETFIKTIHNPYCRIFKTEPHFCSKQDVNPPNTFSESAKRAMI